MNNNFPPLYPQEAYTQQNNTFAFSDESKALDDASKPAPLAGLLSGALNSQNSPLLPLLISALTGKNPFPDDAKTLANQNPILGMLSSLNNKKTPTSSVGEKQFPD